MDALYRLAELIEENPEMSIDAMSHILMEEGYAKSEEDLPNFLKVIGIE